MKIHRIQLALIAVVFHLNLSACSSEETSKSDSPTNHHDKHTNRLIHEKSPYLLQHAHNPVDWYSWGDEALQKAKKENKPIFLSIGYASCHWCHVMERESFENEVIADSLNKYFISIKVDREERPDIDHIYMTAASLLTGGGGWPLSVFLTPELKPFFSGTYFPPDDSYGRPGFMKVITEIARIYREDGDRITAITSDVFDRLQASMSPPVSIGNLDSSLITSGANQMLRSVDRTYGGFGNNRKFPQATQFNLLTLQYHRSGKKDYWEPVEQALYEMQRGGIFDQVGGGFHRYTVDRQWRIPHFEKMLYDNSLLVMLYSDAFQLSGDSSYLVTVQRTLDFMLREMYGKNGEFFSAIDADSEDEEGKFYSWSYSEITRVLGVNAPAFINRHGVTVKGNFEGRNVLYIANPRNNPNSKSGLDSSQFYTDCYQMLFAVREKRIRPITDDKALTSWNGLALAALCRGYQVTGDLRYLKAAQKNAFFIQNIMYNNGYLLHSYREGKKGGSHFLEDYAYYLCGLTQLIQVDRENTDRWLNFAIALADTAITLFADANGHLFLREARADGLIVRPQDIYDGAVPSPGSAFIETLLKLHRLTENKKYLLIAEKSLKSLANEIAQSPGSMCAALKAIDYYFEDKIEIVLVGAGPESELMMSKVNSFYLPNAIVVSSSDGRIPLPLFEGRQSSEGETRAYVCINSVCHLPVKSAAELERQLSEL